MNPTPPPTAAGSLPTKGKVIHLTTTQGLLMVAGLTILFGGIMYWTATRFPQSAKGNVTGAGLNLVPMGCVSSRTGNYLTIPLRPEPMPAGFNEENRAVIIHDSSQEGTTSVPRPVQVSTISWRNADEAVSVMTCDDVQADFTVRSKRRGGQRRIREDLWSGTLVATCQAPEIGEIKIDINVENCD